MPQWRVTRSTIDIAQFQRRCSWGALELPRTFWNMFVKIIFKNVHDRNNDRQLEKTYQFLKISVNCQLLLELVRPLQPSSFFYWKFVVVIMIAREKNFHNLLNFRVEEVTYKNLYPPFSGWVSYFTLTMSVLTRCPKNWLQKTFFLIACLP